MIVNITAKRIRFNQLKSSADFKIKSEIIKIEIKNDWRKAIFTRLKITSSFEKIKRATKPTIAKLPIRATAREL